VVIAVGVNVEGHREVLGSLCVNLS
jgi:transposase-like protein